MTQLRTHHRRALAGLRYRVAEERRIFHFSRCASVPRRSGKQPTTLRRYRWVHGTHVWWTTTPDGRERPHVMRGQSVALTYRNDVFPPPISPPDRGRCVPLITIDPKHYSKD